MKINLFGVGAAGNKAAIRVLEKGILDDKHVKLLNTATEDIPDQYKVGTDLVIKFNSELGGCGKEPVKGKKAAVAAIKNGVLNLAEYIDPSSKAVAIVTAVEGGTGCGATPVLARYFSMMNIPVHIFAFIGFQDEVRGISNSLRFFKEIGDLDDADHIILHTIQNRVFLDYTKNYHKAEQLANDEFAKQIEIMTGYKKIPSAQNIDETDEYKILTTPGYMDIEHIPLNGLAKRDAFDEAIQNAFDNRCCLNYTESCKRLAVIINASDRTQNYVDNTFTVLKRYTGEPFELFRHIQNDESDPEEYMDVIVAGLAYPETGIKDMSKDYTKKKQQLNSSVKTFGDIFSDIDFDEGDDEEYNMDLRHMVNPDDITNDFMKVMGGFEQHETNEPTTTAPKKPYRGQTIIVKGDDDDNDEY
jgi:cell division GTPase FtsZ